MFKRRLPRSSTRWVREFLWPRAGWQRSTRYLMHRLSRLPGSPYSIAAGFACGAAISFTPLVGFHFLTSALLAWVIRANIIASAIGTAVGNPWTFPFIWVWLYNSGTWLGAGGSVAAEHLDFVGVFGSMLEATLRLDMSYMAETVTPVLWPMFASSIPTASVVWAVFYLSLKPLVARYQSRRRRVGRGRLRRGIRRAATLDTSDPSTRKESLS